MANKPREVQDWEGETVDQSFPPKLSADSTANMLPKVRVNKRAPGAADTHSLEPTQEVQTPQSHSRARTLPAAQRGVADGDDLESLPTVERDAYTIGRLIARGGMGRIYQARDRRLGRPVAIKELMSFEPAFVARFEREARITGRLQHPAIVPVYEAGSWPSGEPFFSMKLVAGESLDKVVDKTGSLRERLALVPDVTAVAEALAYAHNHRVVHRDLKPANVLIGEFGETVVIDWGLAKDLSHEDEAQEDEAQDGTRGEGLTGVGLPAGMRPPTDAGESGAAGLTVMGAAMGTPSYMPPEQALGEAVDERADVYALGAILYHVLAGQPTYSECATGEEIIEKVKTEPPTPIAQHEPHAPVDLIAIAEKAMARDPDERYPSAKEMAEDLKRFETGQLVSVHDYSMTSLLWRWLRRHRGVVSVAGVMLLVLIAMAVLSFNRVRRERNVAERERAAAERLRTRAEAAQARAEARSSALTLLNAQAALERDPTAALAWLRDLNVDDVHASMVRLLALEARARGVARHVLRGHQGRVYGLAFSPDGELLASSSNEGMLIVWDARTGTRADSHYCEEKRFDLGFSPAPMLLGGTPGSAWLAVADDDGRILLRNPRSRESRVLEDPEGQEGAVQYMAFSPDGRYLATSSGDRTVRLWHLPSGQVRQRVDTTEQYVQVDFSPDGRYLIISEDEAPQMLEVATGAAVELPRSMRAYALEVSPDGRWVAGSGVKDDDNVYLWELGTQRVVALPGHGGPVRTLAFSPDSASLAAVDGRAVRLWDLATRTSRLHRGHDDLVTSLAFSPDGRQLASGSRDRSVGLLYLSSGERRVLRGHEGWITDLAFSPDGAMLASASQDGTVRIWQPGDGGHEFAVHEGEIGELVISPDSRSVVTAGEDGRIGVTDVRGGRARTLAGHRGPVSAIELSADGAALASAGEDGAVRLWAFGEGDSRVLYERDEPITRLALSPEGDRVASVDRSGAAVLWDIAGGRGRELPGVQRGVGELAFSPDGAQLAYVDGAEVLLWQLGAGEPRRLEGHEAAIGAVAFSPNGELLATAARDHTVRVWNLETGFSRRFDGHRDDVWRLAFAPDGTRLASAGWDGNILLWRPHASGAGRRLEGHHLVIEDISFAADSRLVASASRDGVVRVWDASSERGRIWSQGHGKSPHVEFSPDGRYLATANNQGEVLIWPFDAPRDPAALRAWIGELTTAVIGERDQVASPRDW